MLGAKKEKVAEVEFLISKKIEITDAIKEELNAGNSLKSAKQKLSQIYSKELVDEVFEFFSKENLRQESSEILGKYGDATKEAPELSYFGPTMESIIVVGAITAIVLLLVYLLLAIIFGVFVGK